MESAQSWIRHLLPIWIELACREIKGYITDFGKSANDSPDFQNTGHSQTRRKIE